MPDTCAACQNRGWLLVSRKDASGAPENAVERCDQCERFASDEDAVACLNAAHEMLETLQEVAARLARRGFNPQTNVDVCAVLVGAALTTARRK